MQFCTQKQRDRYFLIHFSDTACMKFSGRLKMNRQWPTTLRQRENFFFSASWWHYICISCLFWRPL